MRPLHLASNLRQGCSPYPPLAAALLSSSPLLAPLRCLACQPTILYNLHPAAPAPARLPSPQPPTCRFLLVQVGSPVTVCGWVDRYRNLGGLLFLDIRDHTGGWVGAASVRLMRVVTLATVQWLP